MADKPWLFEKFVETARDTMGKTATLLNLIDKAGKKAKKKSSAIREALESLLAFIRLVRAWAKGHYRDVSAKTIGFAVAAIIYFLAPLDALPDFLPGLGFVDDASFILYVLSLVREELDRFLHWEKNGPPQEKE